MTITPENTPPTAVATAGNITTPGTGGLNITVTYSDNAAINTATLDGSDIRVTGPKGFSQLAQFLSVNSGASGSPRTAVYRLMPPGGSWDSADNGAYTITIQAGQVKDASNNSVTAKSLTTFTVNITPMATTGAVTGFVFFDANANGFQDAAETKPLAVTVYLDANSNGILDTGERSTSSSSANGSYSFSNVVPRAYQVRQVRPAGYRQTLPTKFYSITVAAGLSSGNWVFGNTALAYIQGRVWNNLNANKSIETGETGLTGWRVFIDANNDGLHQSSETSVLTDANGYFVFNTLAPGTYTVRLEPASKSWIATSRIAQTVTLAAGQVYSRLAFGQRQ